MVKTNKIVIIGPESTGKSTLCTQLAQHYQTLWCKEFAREYLEKNGTTYTYENLLEIAKGQIIKEENAIVKCNENIMKHLFIDTNMYVMKVWCEFVFGKCHNFILEQIVERKYDLYLLCNIDLPWTYDVLREYENEAPRKELFNIYKDILVNQHTNWSIISGTNEQRLQNAISVIDKQFNL